MKERKQIEKPKRASKKPQELAGTLTIGMDLGDKTSRYRVLDGDGNAVIECAVPTTKKGIMTAFGDAPRCPVAMEVGTHSGWVSRQLKGLGFTVIVANPRHLRAITHSSSKDDRKDAQMLAGRSWSTRSGDWRSQWGNECLRAMPTTLVWRSRKG